VVVSRRRRRRAVTRRDGRTFAGEVPEEAIRADDLSRGEVATHAVGHQPVNAAALAAVLAAGIRVQLLLGRCAVSPALASRLVRPACAGVALAGTALGVVLATQLAGQPQLLGPIVGKPHAIAL